MPLPRAAQMTDNIIGDVASAADAGGEKRPPKEAYGLRNIHKD